MDNAECRRKVLMIATVPSMIGQFNMNNIQLLQEIGYEVEIGCNFKDRSVWTEERTEKFIAELKEKKVKYYQLDFTRSVSDIKGHICVYKKLNALIKKNRYAFMHCHTPIASVIGRIVAYQNKLKVIYTAHGFHFFDGAPLKNWLVYYPIEKFFSRWTDVLITINKEDYERTKKKFHAKKVEYIPGVGVDIEKFAESYIDVRKKREELGIDDNTFILLSVGELSERKNQAVVIEALRELKNMNIVYLLVGEGYLREEYENKIKHYNLENSVKLMGHRTDIAELCKIADCFVHPSIREGLGIAPLEAMASGLPLISSYVNGIKDYTEDGKSGCCVSPQSTSEMVQAIKKMYEDKEFRDYCKSNNLNTVKRFAQNHSTEITREIYKSM